MRVIKARGQRAAAAGGRLTYHGSGTLRRWARIFGSLERRGGQPPGSGGPR